MRRAYSHYSSIHFMYPRRIRFVLCACFSHFSSSTMQALRFNLSYIYLGFTMLRHGSLYRVLGSPGPCVVSVRKSSQFSRQYCAKRMLRSTFFRSRCATLSAPSNNASDVNHFEVTIPTWFPVVVHLLFLTDHTNMRVCICLPNPNRCDVHLRSIRSSNDIDTLVFKRSAGDWVSASGIGGWYPRAGVVVGGKKVAFLMIAI